MSNKYSFKESNVYIYRSIKRRISTIKNVKLNAKSKTSNLETIAKFVKRIRKFARERYKGADRKVVQKGTPTRVASSRPRRKGRNSQVDLLPIPSSYPRYFNIGYGNKLRIDVKAASLPSSPLPLHATKTSSSCSLSHLYTSNLSPPFLLPLLFLLSLSVPFFRSVFPFLSLLFFRSSRSPWYMRTGGVI